MDPLWRRNTARQFRQNPTDAERKLWRLLRNKRLANWRFRRQQPVGPYFADFFCAAAKLVIEPDGGHHADYEQIISDVQRTQWLESRGYEVLRFWNKDVLKTPDIVIETIHRMLESAKLPPSP
jgi:adenine-specific DNA-methyltransferase